MKSFGWALGWIRWAYPSCFFTFSQHELDFRSQWFDTPVLHGNRNGIWAFNYRHPHFEPINSYLACIILTLSWHPLLLLSLGLINLGLLSLLPHTNKTSIWSGNTELAISIVVTLDVLDLDLGDSGSVNDRQAEGDLGSDTLAGSGLLDILCGCVVLLDLACSAGEEDEAFLVFL